ncbi:hypothetical protein JCM10908_005936 [Rhodotorula pacifica]|uniref:uncharacterized protein n=1 Tax=Rhodotorula pacifica TaxID=1495444 RepID=UPI00316F95A1
MLRPILRPSSAPTPSSTPATDRLSSLPTALLLRILSHLSLPDLVLGVKPVSRSLYLHAINLARQQALPLWLEEVERTATMRSAAGRGGAPPARGARTGIAALVVQATHGHNAEEDDGLPSYTQAAPSRPSPLASSNNASRELVVFDLFVATLAQSLSRLAASTLLLTGEDDALRIPNDARQDLFGHLQPNARLEDLVVAEGRRRGWIVEPEEQEEAGREEGTFSTVLASDIRIDLKLREARLLLPFRSGSDDRSSAARSWRCIASIARRPEDELEDVARRLVREGDYAGVVRIEEGKGLRRYEL